MPKSKDGIKYKDWGPRIQDMPLIGPVPHVDPEAAEYIPTVGRSKGSRLWLKSHGDDWIERALMQDLMDHRARLIYENGAHSRANPYRAVNLARRLKIHTSALSAWSALRQFPKSFASWRRLCRALKCELRIEVVDRKGNTIFSGLG